MNVLKTSFRLFKAKKFVPFKPACVRRFAAAVQDKTVKDPSNMCSSKIVEKPRPAKMSNELEHEEKLIDDDDDDEDLSLENDEETASAEIVDEPDILLDPTLTREEKAKIKMMKNEYEIWKYADSYMPEVMRNKYWLDMLKMKSQKERITYLTFLANKVFLKQRLREKKQRASIMFQDKHEQAVRERQENQHIYYGFGGNFIFRRFQQDTFVDLFNQRCIFPMIHGPHIVLDCSFMEELSVREQSLTCKQMLECYEVNRSHRQPAHLIYTRYDERQSWTHMVDRSFPPDGFKSKMVTTTSKHYMDLFPKEKLVYLTPDSRQPMTRFDSDKVYIMGALVDKPTKKNLTLARAKREGIESRCLPITEHVRYVAGSKLLCLNHVLRLLLDVNLTNDWRSALMAALPPRALKKPTEEKTQRSRIVKDNNETRIRFLESLTNN